MDDGIEILGTHYSSKLRALYEEVTASHNRPITVTAISGHGDNTFQVRSSDILLRLKPGSTEDNVAHELMHGVLHFEGFPQMFFIPGSSFAELIHSRTLADFEHLVINDRLLQLGYDARRGFLSKGDSFDKVLTLRANGDPDSQTILLLVLLHELMKFCCYYGDARAESEIQHRFPAIRPYWRQLSAVISALPQKAPLLAIWDVVKVYLQTADQIARDQACSTRPSDFIGFVPIILNRAALSQTAASIFELTLNRQADNSVLVRCFLADGRILVGAWVLRTMAGAEKIKDDLVRSAEEFVRSREIRVVQLEK